MAMRICETCKKKGNRCLPNVNGTCKAYEPRAITWFEKLKLMDIEELASWLDKHGQVNNSPWMKQFNKMYCNKCTPEYGYATDCTGEYEWSVPCEYSWCELNDFKCKFFPDMEEAPDNKDMIKMWLQTEVE